MARPREFDIEETLRAAAERFWVRGYRATSIQDIAAATGVKSGSLYKAFGDKRSLFLRCVDQYMDGLSYKEVLVELFDLPLRDCMEGLFESIIEASGAGLEGPVTAEGRRGGCLVTNTAFEAGRQRAGSRRSPDEAPDRDPSRRALALGLRAGGW